MQNPRASVREIARDISLPKSTKHHIFSQMARVSPRIVPKDLNFKTLSNMMVVHFKLKVLHTFQVYFG